MLYKMKKLKITFLLFFSIGFLNQCGTESIPDYTLTIFVSGEGTVSPEGGNYERGETVTLTSNPSSGWLFQNWGGDGDGTSNTISFTMNKDINIVANFQRRDYPLTINLEGEGTVEERIVSLPKTTEYPFEAVIELTSKPNDGWVFYQWEGGISGDNNPETIEINEENEVTSIFKSIDELLIIDIIGEGTVNVTQESFEENPSRRKVTLTANPRQGWRIEEWSGDISSTADEIELSLEEVKNISVTFENENNEFYEEFASKEGVEMTDSGLLYRVLEEGSGIVPTPESVAIFDYLGKLSDDEVFNNTFEDEQPVSVAIDQLPIGLEEGLLLIPIGSRVEFVMLPELGYGENPPAGIPQGAVLYFEVKLLHSSNYDSVFLEDNAQREEITETQSGLQYRVIDEGSGESPGPSSSVGVEYTGTFIYGDTFDTSRNTAGPATFNVNSVIEGFAEGVQLMQVGARYELFLPGDLAYGDNPPQQSAIYPGATLIFDVELISVDD